MSWEALVETREAPQGFQVSAMSGSGQGAALGAAGFQPVGGLGEGDRVMGMHRGTNLADKKAGIVQVGSYDGAKMSGRPRCLVRAGAGRRRILAW